MCLWPSSASEGACVNLKDNALTFRLLSPFQSENKGRAEVLFHQISNQLQLQNGRCRSTRGQIWQLSRKKNHQIFIVNYRLYLHINISNVRCQLWEEFLAAKRAGPSVFIAYHAIFMSPLCNAVHLDMHNPRSSKKRSHL